MKRLVALLIIGFALTLPLQSGCSRYAAGAITRIVTAAALTAAVVAVHDAHFHHAHCGHHYIIVEDRPVYHYRGRWEYYEPESDSWYYYDRPPYYYR